MHLHVKTSKTFMSHSVIGSVKMWCYPKKFFYNKNHITGVYYFTLIFCIKYIRLESKMRIYFLTADLENCT